MNNRLQKLYEFTVKLTAGSDDILLSDLNENGFKIVIKFTDTMKWEISINNKCECEFNNLFEESILKLCMLAGPAGTMELRENIINNRLKATKNNIKQIILVHVKFLGLINNLYKFNLQ